MFVCHLVFNVPLHAARRAMEAALPFPLKATAGFYRYTHFLPPESEAVIVGVSQRPLLPITARESKKRERTKQRKKQHILSGPPPPLLLHLLWSGLGPSLDLRLARTLLGDRGLDLGRLVPGRLYGPLSPPCPCPRRGRCDRSPRCSFPADRDRPTGARLLVHPWGVGAVGCGRSHVATTWPVIG